MDQVLPFASLAWENFERLNLRLARRRGEVDHAVDRVPVGSPRWKLSQKEAVAAKLYGRAGQDQEGIDLYVRLPEGQWSSDRSRQYLSLQSRRIAVLTAAKLGKAVNEFLAGDWADASRVFVYAVSLSGVERKFDDEVRKQRARLEKLGIGFEVWDAEELSAQLKTEPYLVDDFFGRRWVERFVSSEAAAALGGRLDAAEVGALRTKLASFYTTFFDLTDSGMAALQRADAPRVAFRDRFVVPDVLAQAATVPGSVSSTLSRPTVTALQWWAQSEGSRVEMAAPEAWGGAGGSARDAAAVAHGAGEPASAPWLADVEARTGIDEWLASSDRHLLVGGPGSGKSTFLRFALLDLLSEQPVLPGWTARFGDRLPVWLPFHFFTRRRAYDDDRASVSSTLKAWLEHNDGAYLWDLVAKALQDERLLLIVDGLDEWETEEAARSASTALEAFLDQRDLPALFSTRPYGVRRVAMSGVWSRAELAPLSAAQQHTLATIWFTAAHAAPADHGSPHGPGGDRSVGPALLGSRVEDFTRELEASGDLRQLARVPLFLLLLVGLRLADVKLPRRRFEVYERVVDQFLQDHPAKRGTAASLARPRSGLTDQQVRSVLAQIAFTHQERGMFGPVLETQVRRMVIDALRNPEVGAMDAGAAALAGEQFIQIAEGELGVLVRQSHRDLGFFHRALMEQLAAEYAVDYLAPETLHTLVAEHAGDARWSEVLLAIMWRLRPNQMPAVVDILADHAVPDRPAGMAAAHVLAEAVFGGFGLAPGHARRHATRVLEMIDTHPYVPLRQRLLKAVLPGLRQPVLAGLLLGHLQRWTVAHQPVPAALLDRLGSVVDDSQLPSPVWPVLAAALRGEDVLAVSAAAISLICRYADGERRDETLEALLRAAAQGPTAEHTALITHELIRSWPEDQCVTRLIAHARRQDALPVRLVGLAGALGTTAASGPGAPLGDRRGDVAAVTPAERDWLTDQLGTADTDRLWLPLLANTLLAAVAEPGQPRDSVLDSCLEILDKGSRRYGDRHLAWAVLLQGFAQEPRTIAFVCGTLRTDHSLASFLGLGPLARAYPEHPQVSAAADTLLDGDGARPLDFDLPALTAMSKSRTVRDYLLQNLASSGTPHWAAGALTAHWDQDPEVVAALRTMLLSEPRRASRIARAAAPVLGPDAALTRLLQLLEPPADTARLRVDIVTLALLDTCQDLGITQGPQADRVAAACLDALTTFKYPGLDGIAYEVIVRLPRSAPARTLTTELLAAPQAPLDAITHAYGDDPDIIATVVKVLNTTHPALPTPARRTLHTLLAGDQADSATVCALTRNWPLEPEDLARSAASAAYHTHLTLQHDTGTLPQNDWQQAIDILAQHSIGKGFMSWGQQRSAWLGILLTDELHLLTEGGLQGGKLMLSDTGPDADLLLLAALADRWPHLRAHLGTSPVKRLTTALGGGPDSGAWGYLALVADREPSLAAELGAAVASEPGLLDQPGVLAWYANKHHGEPGLLETLRSTSDSTNLRPLANLLLAESHLLGLEPESVRVQLHADLPQGWARDLLPSRSSALEALADGFPEDEEVNRYWKMLTRAQAVKEAVRMEPRTYFALTYAAVPAEDLLSQLRGDIARLNRWGPFVDHMFARALIRRLRRDEEARDCLSNHVQSQQTSDAHSAQLTALLAAASTLTDPTLNSLHARLNHQAQQSEPDTVRDYCTSQNLPVPLLLLRTLDASPNP
ncbi:NACHT domain-containing protein [Streptomyces sp. H10-C2]|uniref:NACHT domain-containing protein n=1 Tax=unclassified Streptomyces TaxID=2593676 RepID=UPI0024B930DF|nr:MULTISPECIES: NACHT domain-containing protein [unclassified Streptomyces]MDJ0346967.1 NACHT domain-containing protein [Streptomyces sp. PH10-H1]MDJ0374632.1 NACHT domain-containing protein [Streptomyces sp. H10-C2]